MPCMRGEAVAIASTLLTPCAVSRMAWIRIGFAQFVARFELREQLVEIVDVPRAIDLRQHDDVELVADRATISVTSSSAQGELSALMRVHSPVAPKSVAFAISMKPRARRLLGVGRNGVLEIAEHDVDLPHEFRHLGAHLLDVRRHEMDHALEPHRQFAQRRRRADGERLKELARQLHGRSFQNDWFCPLEQCKGRAK